jgi:excisionase family DNA binding protein
MTPQFGRLESSTRQFVQGKNCWHPSPKSSGRIRVVYGPDTDLLEGVIGTTVSQLHRALATPFNLPNVCTAFVNGMVAFPGYQLRLDDHLEFVMPWGRKGADDSAVPPPRPLLTVKEAAAELHCSISFVYKLMQTGQLSFEQRGRRRLPLAFSVAEYRERNTFQASELQPRPVAQSRQPYEFQRLFKRNRPKPRK